MAVNIKKLKSLSKKYEVSYTIKQNGHVQIKGALLVNYYPLSKKQTAYIAQTKVGLSGVSYDEAFKLSVTIPKSQGINEKRKSNYIKEKKKLFNRKPWCHWCGKMLETKTATLDHVVPISIGGLNNMNNYVLACYNCNQKRGNKMPEITEVNNE